MSYNLNASTGFNREARRAGNRPAKKPIRPITPIIIMTCDDEITGSPTYSVNPKLGDIFSNPLAIIKPMKPPMAVMSRDSVRSEEHTSELQSH